MNWSFFSFRSQAKASRSRLSWIAIILLLLCATGLYIIANYNLGNSGSPVLTCRQLISIVIAFGCVCACLGISIENWNKITPWLGLAGIISLICVLIFGSRLNGMRGWFRIGFLSIQPSEICKPIFILWNAWLCLRTNHLKNSPKRILIHTTAALLWLGLIVLEPDFGTALIYFLTFLAIQFAAGIPKRHIVVVLAVLLAAGTVLLVSKPYAIRRLSAFFSSSQEAQLGGNWHVIQMQKSLRHGGWLGQEHHSLQHYTNMPYPFSDSFFAYTAERMGFLGILPILLLPLIWLGFCCRTANQSSSQFQKLVIIGNGFIIFIQATIHLAVNTGMMPPTGVTLPLLSYGGSSIVATSIILASTFAKHQSTINETVSQP